MTRRVGLSLLVDLLSAKGLLARPRPAPTMGDSRAQMKFLHVLAVALGVLACSIAGAQDKDLLAQYCLGPGDSIRVSVFQNPNLTLETRVGEDGAITYPLV